MATTACAATKLSRNTSVTGRAFSAGTAINAANTMVITPGTSIENLHIMVVNTTAGGGQVATVVEGASPPADANGIGTTTVTLGAGNVTPTWDIIVLSSSRYCQSDGTIHLTFSVGMTGFVYAFYTARGGA